LKKWLKKDLFIIKGLGTQCLVQRGARAPGVNNPFFGKTHTTETKIKMSKAKGTPIFVYDANMQFIDFFTSANAAAADYRIEVSRPTIVKNLDKGRLINNKYSFYSSERI